MVDSVILTVKVERTSIEYDMELPANVPGKELCGKLLSALKNLEGVAFSGVEKISLRVMRNGRLLGDRETLETAEVWDGNTVIVGKGG